MPDPQHTLLSVDAIGLIGVVDRCARCTAIGVVSFDPSTSHEVTNRIGSLLLVGIGLGVIMIHSLLGGVIAIGLGVDRIGSLLLGTGVVRIGLGVDKIGSLLLGGVTRMSTGLSVNTSRSLITGGGVVCIGLGVVGHIATCSGSLCCSLDLVVIEDNEDNLFLVLFTGPGVFIVGAHITDLRFLLIPMLLYLRLCRVVDN